MQSEFVDYFGTPLVVGQRVLHISRYSSEIIRSDRIVTRVDLGGVSTRVADDPAARSFRVTYPHRLIVHPDDARPYR